MRIEARFRCQRPGGDRAAIQPTTRRSRRDTGAFETIEKPGDTFTLRERDSMKQKRTTEAELFARLEEQVY